MEIQDLESEVLDQIQSNKKLKPFLSATIEFLELCNAKLVNGLTHQAIGVNNLTII